MDYREPRERNWDAIANVLAMKSEKPNLPEFSGPRIDALEAIATATFMVSPPLYYTLKAAAFMRHRLYRRICQDEPGVEWKDSKHKAVLDKVYKF